MLTCVLLYLPWLLYQKLYDPPGNFLLKLQLAGVEHVDNESFLQDATTAYSRLTFREWLNARRQNVTTVIDHQGEYWEDVERLFTSIPKGHGTIEYGSARQLRMDSFFYFMPNLGWLAAGPLFLLPGVRKRFRTREWQSAALLWTVVICTLIPWCLIMFVPGSTSIHQGTYVAVLLASTASVLAFWAVLRWLAYAVSAAQIMQSVLMYGFFMRQSPTEGALLEGTAHYGVIALFFVTFILCWFMIAQLAGDRATGFVTKEVRSAPDSYRPRV
jgi:hypothetical protein